MRFLLQPFSPRIYNVSESKNGKLRFLYRPREKKKTAAPYRRTERVRRILSKLYTPIYSIFENLRFIVRNYFARREGTLGSVSLHQLGLIASYGEKSFRAKKKKHQIILIQNLQNNRKIRIRCHVAAPVQTRSPIRAQFQITISMLVKVENSNLRYSTSVRAQGCSSLFTLSTTVFFSSLHWTLVEQTNGRRIFRVSE